MSIIRSFKAIACDGERSLEEMRPSLGRISNYRNRFRERFLRKRLPVVFLETTSTCNLNCVICPTQRPAAKRFKPDGFMEPGLFRHLVDEVAADNPLSPVRLHKDGEPFLHPQIIELIDYAASRLPNTLVVTNGTMLNREIARVVLKTRLRQIRISIDGATKSTFEKIRKPAVNYESIRDNVLALCELKKKSGNPHLSVGVRITDFEATRDEMEEFKSFWKEHVDFIEVSPLLSWSGRVTRESGDTSGRYPCLNLWSQLVVAWDGTMVPCCVYVDTTGDGLGRLADLNNATLKSAFYGPPIQRLRRAHLDNDLDRVAPFCRPCRDWRLVTPFKGKVWSEGFKDEMRSALSS